MVVRGAYVENGREARGTRRLHALMWHALVWQSHGLI